MPPPIRDEPVQEVVLRLFVTGSSQRSLRAIEAVQGMCREFLQSTVRVEIVDVLKQPEQAETERSSPRRH